MEAIFLAGEGGPFLKYQLHYWSNQGVSRFILSVGTESHSLKKQFGTKLGTAEIYYSSENSNLGTGGALLSSSAHLSSAGTFLVIAGKTFFEVGLEKMLSFHRAKQAKLTFSLANVEKKERTGGVEVEARRKASTFSAKNGCLINGGVYLMERSFLTHLSQFSGKFSLEEKFPEFLKDCKSVYGFPSTGLFMDGGTSGDYQNCESELAKVGR